MRLWRPRALTREPGGSNHRVECCEARQRYDGEPVIPYCLGVKDFIGVLQRVCYEDRKATYAATLHMVESAGHLAALATLLNRSELVEEGFPTRIYRQGAVEAVGTAALQWFIEHDILAPLSAEEYGLVDEFLCVRMALDAEKPELRADVEAELVAQGHLLSWDEIQDYYAAKSDSDDETDGD